MTDRVIILTETEASLVRIALNRLDADDDARQEILDKLDADPLDGWSPGPWWQVIDADIEASETDPDMAWRKALYCETSDEGEARLHMKKGQATGRNLRIQHLWRRELRMMLTDEDNAVAMSHWRGR